MISFSGTKKRERERQRENGNTVESEWDISGASLKTQVVSKRIS